MTLQDDTANIQLSSDSGLKCGNIMVNLARSQIECVQMKAVIHTTHIETIYAYYSVRVISL